MGASKKKSRSTSSRHPKAPTRVGSIVTGAIPTTNIPMGTLGKASISTPEGINARNYQISNRPGLEPTSKSADTPTNKANKKGSPKAIIPDTQQDLHKGIRKETKAASEILPLSPTTTLRKIDMSVYFTGRLSFLPKIQVPRDTFMQENSDSLHASWNSRLRYFIANVLFALFPDTSNIHHIQRILNNMPFSGLIGEGREAFKELDFPMVIKSYFTRRVFCSLDFDTSKLHFHPRRWDGTSLEDVQTKPFPDLFKVCKMLQSNDCLDFVLPLCTSMEMIIDDKDVGCTPGSVTIIVQELIKLASFHEGKILAYACCSTLTKLAAIDIFARAILESENGVMHLFGAIKRFPNFQRTHQFELLVLIERLSKCKDVLVGAGAIDMVLQALAQDDHSDLHIDALSALRYLVSFHIEPKQLLKADRIVKAVIKCLKQTTDSPVAKEYSCKILFQILTTHRSCRDVVFAEDGPSSILRAMCTFANCEMQHSSCQVLCYLACSDQLNNAHLEAVLNAIKMHPKDVEVQRPGVTFLDSFSQFECNMPFFDADLTGEAFLTLCSAATQYPNVTFIQASVWRAVTKLVRHNRIDRETFSRFGVYSIQDILKRVVPFNDHAWNEPLVRPHGLKATMLLLGGVCIEDAYSYHPMQSDCMAIICLFTLLEVQNDPEVLTIASAFLIQAKYAAQQALSLREKEALSFLENAISGILESLPKHSENEMITAALCSFTRRLVTPQKEANSDIKELLLLGGGADLFRTTLSRFPKNNEILQDCATVYLYLRDYGDERRSRIRSAKFFGID